MYNTLYFIWILGGLVGAIWIYHGTNLASFGSINDIKEYVSNVIGQQEPLTAPLGADTLKNWKDGPRAGYQILSDDDIRYVDGGKPYLVILGHVFDVTKGFKSYAPGSGYHGFIGKDGSRAFVTGDFSEKGLVSNVDGLSAEDYDGLAKWLDFYFESYKFVGYHVGRFFDRNGKETEDMAEFKAAVAQSEKENKEKGNMKKAFPPCNMEWKSESGTRYWCSKMSGGIERDWEGFPHLFTEDGGKSARCACIKELGSKDRRVRQYENCTKDSKICFPQK